MGPRDRRHAGLRRAGLAPVPYEHQLAAVKTVLNRLGGRALPADEVGLGKTVEAGIVLSDLLRRRLARRVLILVPPGLVTQWREELRHKFGLDFVTHDTEAFRQEPVSSPSRLTKKSGAYGASEAPVSQ